MLLQLSLLLRFPLLASLTATELHRAIFLLQVYERVSGHKHRGDKSFEQGGVGMPTLSKDALMKGAFAGAGVKVEREALTGECGVVCALTRREWLEWSMPPPSLR